MNILSDSLHVVMGTVAKSGLDHHSKVADTDKQGLMRQSTIYDQ